MIEAFFTMVLVVPVLIVAIFVMLLVKAFLIVVDFLIGKDG